MAPPNYPKNLMDIGGNDSRLTGFTMEGLVERQLEVRKLPPCVLFELSRLLDCGHAWKEVMARVERESVSDNARRFKYTAQNIKIIEKTAEQQRRSCTEIFFDEWGTSGRRRPTMSSLLDLLVKARLFRAADYVAEKLGEVAPARPAETPAAFVDVSDTAIEALLVNARLAAQDSPINPNDVLVNGSVPLAERNNNADAGSGQGNTNNEPPPDVAPESGVKSHPYRHLEIWTGDFSEGWINGPNGRTNRLLGSGGFGSVFLAQIPGGEFVAVKRLHSTSVIPDLPARFSNEVTTLSRIRHPNLLSLVGYSNDGPDCCLLYEYLDGGNLQHRLAKTNPFLEPLAWHERLIIADGVAKGLVHLHTAPGGPFVHRDVKSANILLSLSGEVKLGDFGLIRWGSAGDNTYSIVTTNAAGSSPYMAIEAFRGDVSVKLDTFSFGVVLLELLTALPPFDKNRENRDLVTHIQDVCEDSIVDLLDSSAGDWPRNVIDDLYKLTQDCLNDKKDRPRMTEVMLRLSVIVEQRTNGVNIF